MKTPILPSVLTLLGVVAWVLMSRAAFAFDPSVGAAATWGVAAVLLVLVGESRRRDRGGDR